MATQTPPDDARTLRATFDAAEPLTVGIEEELMLLDPETHDLAPVAPQVLERLGGDKRFKLELPAGPHEMAPPAGRSVAGGGAPVARARRERAGAAEWHAPLAGGGLQQLFPAG